MTPIERPDSASAESGEQQLADFSYLQGLSTHEPQPVNLPAEFGGLTLTVPSELPELKPEEAAPGDQVKAIAARTSFFGELGGQSVGLIAYRLATGYEFDLNAAADEMMESTSTGVTFRELSRSPDQVAGKPALRLVCEIKSTDGTNRFARIQWVRNHPYAYQIAVTDTDQSFLKGEAVKHLFLSMKLPHK
jgi:hypothetical protein